MRITYLLDTWADLEAHFEEQSRVARYSANSIQDEYDRHRPRGITRADVVARRVKAETWASALDTLRRVKFRAAPTDFRLERKK